MVEGDDFLKKLQAENVELRERNAQVNTANMTQSAYQGQEDPNLIQYQVETGEMLGKIEHFLRGEYVKQDAEGNEYWAKPVKTIAVKEKGKEKFIEVIDDDLILLNEYGVNSILTIIGSYIDKNTILSYYDEMRINEILADLGDELANFVFCNYEKMGMDTEFKKTRFQLMVITILHSIESTYRRSIRGKTMEDINTSKILTQSDNIGNRTIQTTKKAFNPFKPGTW